MAAIVAVGFAAPAVAEPKKVLVVTTTVGFRHSSIEAAEKVIASLGRSSGDYEVELASVKPLPDQKAYEDQVRAVLAEKLAPAALKRYDGIVFANTTGDLPLPDRDALVQWVRGGGAFIGMHSASDTLHGHRPYVEMLGGEFEEHREQVTIDAISVDAANPATAHLGPRWNLDGRQEEIYLFKNYERSSVHELLVLDKHPNTGQPGHHPIAWCREFGQGRVFYTALGHNEYVWEMPAFQRHVLGGIEWALRVTTPGKAP
jgi:hypothetical protein